jgi:uncharacterized protein (UPF0303 family)
MSINLHSVIMHQATGPFLIIIGNVDVVGAVANSGLPDKEDHQIRTKFAEWFEAISRKLTGSLVAVNLSYRTKLSIVFNIS